MNWLRLLLAFPLLSVLGGWLLWSVQGALRSGAANAGGTRVDARRQPLFFWLVVLVQFAFGALSLWLAARLVLSAF